MAKQSGETPESVNRNRQSYESVLWKLNEILGAIEAMCRRLDAIEKHVKSSKEFGNNA